MIDVITPDQIRRARVLLGWSTQMLAKKSKRSLATIASADKGIASTHTLVALQQLFEAAGVEFTDDGGPGVKIRTEG